jgi:hypothetical protein
VSGAGDHVPEMSPVPLLDDVTTDAILDGDRVPDELGQLAAFAAAVRAIGSGPAPRPSPPLAEVLTMGGPAPSNRPTRVTARRTTRRSALARAAGVGLVVKVGFAASAAAAGVVGAGAAGVLPGGADRVVRDAIEVVTPVEFTDDGQVDDRGVGGRGPSGPTVEPGDAEPGDPDAPSDPGEHGDRVSSDATGTSDGEPGVDGPAVAQDAPGATHRPAEPPGRSDTAPPADPGTPPLSVPQGGAGGPVRPVPAVGQTASSTSPPSTEAVGGAPTAR